MWQGCWKVPCWWRGISQQLQIDMRRTCILQRRLKQRTQVTLVCQDTKQHRSFVPWTWTAANARAAGNAACLVPPAKQGERP